jgi:TetR/AcrR family transcriptional repressor of nem operon
MEMDVKKQASEATPNSREAILEAARLAAQSRGYAGLNFRELADTVGIKHASLYYHFATKADLAAAVAKRYWEDTAAELDGMLADALDPTRALHAYPNIFRKSLQNGNRLCLCSFMSAEYDDLPEAVKTEVQAFTDVNVAWLTKVLTTTGLAKKASVQRAKSIYAAVAGAQLMARSRADLPLFDCLMEGYRAAGLLPA